jgi:hypothetical protein
MRPEACDHRRPRSVALGLAALRVALGAGALAVPEIAGRAWIGADATGGNRSVILRALGGRDLALGLGALLGAARTAELQRWAAMGALSDLTDTAATAARFATLPARRRWLVLAASAGAAVAGTFAAVGLGGD